MTWETLAPISAPESFLVAVSIGSRYQIGFKRVGSELFRFVYDFNDAEQTNLSSAYTETADEVSLVVPLSALPASSSPVDWYATVSIDGTDVARCPATGSSTFGDD